MKKAIAALCASAIALSPLSAAQEQAPPPANPAGIGGILVEQDTLIRLMVLNEVSSRTTKAGERFVLRVDEPVVVSGVTIIPVGAKAWGEVLSADKSGATGKAGTLAARLLYVETGSSQIPISGESQAKGEKGTKQVVLGAIGLGILAPLALLAPGNNAKLKAGEIFNAYFTGDMLFDPATSTFTPAAAPAALALPVEAK
ncbi:MAG TPA: hypothetical protein VF631_06980 [Allosphingosinicella sp.]|jgi:hypothetical protein|uniref:hypothetical protein n=1 Tax=Allosphingosinicella sp. TaxID=2823234 RepID=UPI002F2ABCCD